MAFTHTDTGELAYVLQKVSELSTSTRLSRCVARSCSLVQPKIVSECSPMGYNDSVARGIGGAICLTVPTCNCEETGCAKRVDVALSFLLTLRKRFRYTVYFW